MRRATLFACILATTSALAIEFSLDCRVDSGAPLAVKKMPKMKLIKKPIREKGQWNNDHYLIRLSDHTEIALQSAQNGDEDYNDYEVVKPNRYMISGASIQNRFQWAAILVDGTGWIDCR